MRPLVLVHGFMGGGAQWDGQVQALGGRRKVLAVDLPGFGAKCDLAAPDSIAGFAQAVLNDVSQIGFETFDLLGHSMGGMIAQEMAVMRPDRIARLVLYGTGAKGALPGRFETIKESKRRATQDGAAATARRIAATWFLDGERSPGFAACAAIAERSTLQSIHAGLDAMAGWSRTAELDRIVAPTLILWGDHDRSYGWAQIEELWRSIPDSHLAVVPGCAHAVHLEKAEIFNLLVADFLQAGHAVGRVDG